MTNVCLQTVEQIKYAYLMIIRDNFAYFFMKMYVVGAH